MTTFSKLLFAGLFGILYTAFGLTMILSALLPGAAEITLPWMIPTDPAGGFVLCVVGTVFLFAWQKLAAASGDGYAFLCMGMALAALFGIVALVAGLARGIEMLVFGDGEPWSPAGLLVPMFWLALVPSLALFTWGRVFMHDLVGA